MDRLFLTLILSVTFFGGLAEAHQDTLLKYENGRLTGLPDKYQPASFDRKNKVLTIAGKSLRFPQVLQRLFTDDHKVDFMGQPMDVKGDPYRLVFSASWYHSERGSNLPPYLLIRIEPEKSDHSFEILIDLDQLKFLRADVQSMVAGTIPVDLDGVVDDPVGKEDPVNSTK